MNPSERRVVVTGIGTINPLGLDSHSSWQKLINSQSGIRLIKRFDTSSLSVKIAGIISDDEGNEIFMPEKYIEFRELKKMDLFIQYGVVAADEAIIDSGIDQLSSKEKEDIGVVIGSGIGGLYTIETNAYKVYKENFGRAFPFFIPASLINLISGHVSIKYGFLGHHNAVSTACATGTNAIGDAARVIARGDADIIIAGASEAGITPLGISGFASAKALTAKFNDNPKEASRPWDEDRSGFVIGEGAGILVLEEYEHAKKRGAKIYAEVLGYGTSSDAYHITSPHPEGFGAIKSMKKALLDARLNSEDICYINAHATSTIIGDEIELKAIQELFSNSQKLKVSSTKSATGHALGGAGAIEAVFSILALKYNVAPPTLNLHKPIKNTVLNLVPHEAEELRGKYVLSNSFGFGGVNASLIFGKV